MQRIDFLLKENKKDQRTDSFKLETAKINRKQIQAKPEKLHTQENQQISVSNDLEFVTGLAWCQALLFKSWIEAFDKLIKTREEKRGDALEISSLYVDIHEEVFTNLFKSQLYTSNLGRMINASMLMMKNWQNHASSSSSDNAGCLNKNK
ncbi:MAG: hypothetical protein KGI27_00900 [Thaumarchaeota archaeon]|nr:hypothetical protein [Nitrososphaerota archaeon]